MSAQFKRNCFSFQEDSGAWERSGAVPPLPGGQWVGRLGHSPLTCPAPEEKQAGAAPGPRMVLAVGALSFRLTLATPRWRRAAAARRPVPAGRLSSCGVVSGNRRGMEEISSKETLRAMKNDHSREAREEEPDSASDKWVY